MVGVEEPIDATTHSQSESVCVCCACPCRCNVIRILTLNKLKFKLCLCALRSTDKRQTLRPFFTLRKCAHKILRFFFFRKKRRNHPLHPYRHVLENGSRLEQQSSFVWMKRNLHDFVWTKTAQCVTWKIFFLSYFLWSAVFLSFPAHSNCKRRNALMHACIHARDVSGEATRYIATRMVGPVSCRQYRLFFYFSCEKSLVAYRRVAIPSKDDRCRTDSHLIFGPSLFDEHKHFRHRRHLVYRLVEFHLTIEKVW